MGYVWLDKSWTEEVQGCGKCVAVERSVDEAEGIIVQNLRKKCSELWSRVLGDERRGH